MEKGQGTQDQGFWIWVSVEDSTPPLYKFGTNIPQKAKQHMEIQPHLPWCPLKPFLTSFFSPRGSNPKTSGQWPPTFPFKNLPAGVCPVPHGPSICSLVQLTSFSPQPARVTFPLTPPLPLPRPLFFFNPANQGGETG